MVFRSMHSPSAKINVILTHQIRGNSDVSPGFSVSRKTRIALACHMASLNTQILKYYKMQLFPQES